MLAGTDSETSLSLPNSPLLGRMAFQNKSQSVPPDGENGEKSEYPPRMSTSSPVGSAGSIGENEANVSFRKQS